MREFNNIIELIRYLRKEYPLYTQIVLAVNPAELHNDSSSKRLVWCLPGLRFYSFEYKETIYTIDAITVARLCSDISHLSILGWLLNNPGEPQSGWPSCFSADCKHWNTAPVIQKYNEKIYCLRQLPLPIADEIGEYLIP